MGYRWKIMWWNGGKTNEEKYDLEQKKRETDNEITTNRLADSYLSIKCQDVKCLAMILEDQQPEHWVYQFVISM